MPPASTAIDPEALLRSAISSVAVAARARGIGIAAHVDLRLPARLVAASGGLDRFLRRGLKRTVEAGQIGNITVALWLDGEGTPGQGPDGTLRVLLEIGRQFAGAARPAAPLTQIWTLPLGTGVAIPQPVRSDAAAESMTVPIEMVPASDQASCGRWRGVLTGRRFLEVRNPVYDRTRLQASLQALDARIDFAGSAGEAIDMLRSAAAEGWPVAAATMDGGTPGLDPVDLARRLRADPVLAATRLILTSLPVGTPLPEDSAMLFDAVPVGSGPQRRILDVVYELLRTEETVPGAAPGPSRGGAIPALGGRRILIAEDVETNQMLLKAVLAPTGAAVEVVADGARVIERHRADPADPILMDLQMPGVGGIAALKEIRAMQGAAGAVPILALTAYALNSDRRKALAAGMDGYLAKPILIEEFYASLRRLLQPAEAG